MNNPKKLELYLSEEVLKVIRECDSGIIKLRFSIKKGEIMGCVGASLGPLLEVVKE